jgi:hypothetical protein
MAARLNGLAFADPSAIDDVMEHAHDLFSAYNPTQVKKSKPLKNLFTLYAGILAAYNEGAIGPGHCDDGGGGEVID